MAQPTDQAPAVRAGGLVTVAFLKAQLDSGSDHLGIFMPLVYDALDFLPAQTFTTQDIQEAMAERHKVAMPQQTVATLLRRATSKGYLLREMGRFKRTNKRMPSPDVTTKKAAIEGSQLRLAGALRIHAEKRGLRMESPDGALEMLLRFLELEQVALLLGAPPSSGEAADTSALERSVVAEFIQDVVAHDQALSGILKELLEGLVLYHAAFLPDLNTASQHFKDLRVFFDSGLIRQALGYEGNAAKTLMRETVDVLKASGVQCLVFDKTVYEIRRILSMYENRLGTAEGRSSLRPGPMVRHFLAQRFTPSDVRGMSALLDREIVAAGFQIVALPKHVRDYTAAEHALAARLADKDTKDGNEPRVIHDVDCVAGILTLRQGHRSSGIEDARAVFATGSTLVILNSRRWWIEDEHETGIEPVVNIRALSNLAWLKKPSLCSDFKMRELVALCAAALHPDQSTWERFLRHLKQLQMSGKLSDAEVATILVSAMSDRLLRDAEDEWDPNDIDAATLDEIVDRVTASYGADAKRRAEELKAEYAAKESEYAAKLSEAEARERSAAELARRVETTAAEERRRRDLIIEGRARAWSRYILRSIRVLAAVFLVLGAIELVGRHAIPRGWIGIIAASPVILFIALELAGVLKHLNELLRPFDVFLVRRFHDWLASDTNVEPKAEAEWANQPFDDMT